MASTEVALLSSKPNIPIARTRRIYCVDEVARKLDKLPTKEHENLRALYAHMIEKGAERFQVKPSRLPTMDHLYDDLPNFTEVLDDIRRQLALCVDSKDALEIAPLLLLGPPGIGKTHFARMLGQLLQTGFGFISMSSMTAGWVLSGASSQWKGARPGKVFETLVDGQYANPVMLVDEIDKARGEHVYDPLGSLYVLLEHDTAKHFTDEFAEIPIDTSQIIWIATANDVRGIPDPIVNRMNVYEILAPTREAARHIAAKLYASIRESHDWGSQFECEPTDDALDHMSEMAPREMRRAWMTAFGNAKLVRRVRIFVKDIPETQSSKTKMGFTPQS